VRLATFLILLGIIGFAAALSLAVIMSYGLSTSSVGILLKNSFVFGTVTVDELKTLAQEGYIPYEVYRLALYEKLKDSNRHFKLGKGGVVYTFSDDPDILRFLEGRYIEKINDTWYKVVIVIFDNKVTRKYVILKVNVSTEILDEKYVLESLYPRYLEFKKDGSGRISVTFENKTVGMDLVVSHLISKNPEDARISNELANQIESFAERNNLDITWKFYITSKIPVLMGYIWDTTTLIFRFIPQKIDVLYQDKLITVNLSRSDSLIEYTLLKGGGPCWLNAYLLAYILNLMGINAHFYSAEVFLSNNSTIVHSFIAIPTSEVDPDNLEKLYLKRVAHKMVIPASVSIGNITADYIIYDPVSGTYEIYNNINWNSTGWWETPIIKI